VEAFRRGYESVRLLTWAEETALPGLGEAAALRFTLTRLHDRIFHDPTKLVTPKDPAAFFRRMAYWRVSRGLGRFPATQPVDDDVVGRAVQIAFLIGRQGRATSDEADRRHLGGAEA
jgi:hypothetical protein